MTLRDDFIAEIRAFLRETGMEPSKFGLKGMNDPNFVFEVERGRSVRLDTIERVRRFMEAQRASIAGGATHGCFDAPEPPGQSRASTTRMSSSPAPASPLGRRECGPEQSPTFARGRHPSVEWSMTPGSHAVSVALLINRIILLRLHGTHGEVVAYVPLRAGDAVKIASELLSRVDDARDDGAFKRKATHH